MPSLISRVSITENVGLHTNGTAIARDRGLDNVFGETNSVSGGGSPEISKTFGAALWVLDHSLRTTSQNITRLYFHHGDNITSFYIWWTPTGVTSPYYGGYAATAAMAGGSHIIAPDDGTINYAAYAVYGVDKRPCGLCSLTPTTMTGAGCEVPKLLKLGVCVGARMPKWLRAANALVRQDEGGLVTLAGKTFSNETCSSEGEDGVGVIPVVDGKATLVVRASEALIVEL